MDIDIPKIVLAFGSIVAFIRYVTKDIDAELNPEKRLLVVQSLRLGKPKTAHAWLPDFVYITDKFYGPKHLSLRCFLRSSAISLTCFVLLFLFYYSSFNDLKEEDWLTEPLFFPSMVFSLSVVNLLADYISLYQTRKILKSSLPTPFKIVVDMLLTLLCVFAMQIIVLSFFGGLTSSFELVTAMAKDVFTLSSYFSADREWVFLGSIFYLTAYTTSVWLWLHAISVGLIKLVSPIKSVMSWLNVEEAPIRAIGTTINILICASAIVVIPIFLILT